MAERGLSLQKWKCVDSDNNSPQLMKAELDTPLFSLSLSYGEPHRGAGRTYDSKIPQLAHKLSKLFNEEDEQQQPTNPEIPR